MSNPTLEEKEKICLDWGMSIGSYKSTYGVSYYILFLETGQKDMSYVSKAEAINNAYQIALRMEIATKYAKDPKKQKIKKIEKDYIIQKINKPKNYKL